MGKLLLFFFCISLNSCVALKSVSLTQIPKVRKKPIKAEVSKYIFLGINFNNDFVDGITEDLKDQCKGGKIAGVLTKDEITNYLILFKRTVSARAYCLR